MSIATCCACGGFVDTDFDSDGVWSVKQPPSNSYMCWPCAGGVAEMLRIDEVESQVVIEQIFEEHNHGCH